MSRTARKSKRPDPTVAPIQLVLATGKFALRDRFSPSTHQENLRDRSAVARKANRAGVRGLKARDCR